jgi:hypothetical protein
MFRSTPSDVSVEEKVRVLGLDERSRERNGSGGLPMTAPSEAPVPISVPAPPTGGIWRAKTSTLYFSPSIKFASEKVTSLGGIAVVGELGICRSCSSVQVEPIFLCSST